MDKKFVAKMKKNLLELKNQIYINLSHENEDFNEIIKDKEPKDLGDIAADDIGRSILEALSNQEMKQLRQIESALYRIENGHYGTCMVCEKKIPLERLQAIPYALLCINCKTSEERKNR
jgi:DnaK suppressor protein